MSYQYHGTTGLITLPGREVQTFPSGLVRITRTYVCRKGLEGQFRQLLAEGSVLPNDDAAPCIDGAYIFPTPIENIRDDGFVEFRVTAYGRATLNKSGELNAEIVSVSRNYQRTLNEGSDNERTINWSITEQYIVDSFSQEFVVLSATTNQQIEIPRLFLSRQLISRRVVGTVPGPVSIALRWDTQIANITRRNFGGFNEVSVTFRSIPTDNPFSFSYRDLV